MTNSPGEYKFHVILTYAFSRVPFRFWRTLYPCFGYLELKEVLTLSPGIYPAVPILSVMNSKYFSTFMLLTREIKIGWQVRLASWTFSPTLRAPVEKNNVWPVNGHPIDLPAWFLAGAHGQKWIRAGPHDADTGVGKNTSPVICVQLTEPQSQELHLILLTCKKYV